MLRQASGGFERPPTVWARVSTGHVEGTLRALGLLLLAP